MSKQLISFGKEKTYWFKEVNIDEKCGYPILADGQIIGGLLLEVGKHKNYSCIWVLGIEIEKKYRKQGIATHIIDRLKKQTNAILGAIVNPNEISFWKNLGAVFFENPIPIPPEPNELEIPLVFYITMNKKITNILEKAFSSKLKKIIIKV